MRSFQILRNAKFMTSMENRVSKMEAVAVLASAGQIFSRALAEDVKEALASNKLTIYSDSSSEEKTLSLTFSMTASLAWGEGAAKVAKDKRRQSEGINLEGSECSMTMVMTFSEVALAVGLEAAACLAR